MNPEGAVKVYRGYAPLKMRNDSLIMGCTGMG